MGHIIVYNNIIALLYVRNCILLFYCTKEISNYGCIHEVPSHPDDGHSSSTTTKVKRTALCHY